MGICYNPYSLTQLLSLSQEELIDSIQNNDGLYFSYHLHSEFNAPEKQAIEDKIKANYNQQSTLLKHADVVFISLGTCWVYELKENHSIVNNCHKQNDHLFSKRLLSQKEIVKHLEQIASSLEDKTLVFTVSPIRHLKDGWRENTISKAQLNIAVNAICSAFTHCYYFPSYELLMDDLRDYRFYEKDLLHPNEMAIDYIWEHFQDGFFTKQTQSDIKEVNRLLVAYNHKAFQPQSTKHIDFLYQLRERMASSKHDFKAEIADIDRQLLSQ